LGVQFGCVRPPEELAPYARAAEAAGFDELWVVEDCFFAGSIASVTAALASTERLTVGLGIVPAVSRNPAFTAMEFAALARLFPGRFLPGLGHGVAGWMRQIGAFPASQLAALEEVTTVVRALLAGEEVTFHGRHVHLDAVRLDHPSAEAPPVSLGVRGPASLALSGRCADGTILAEGAGPAYVRWALEQIAPTRPHRLTVFMWWARMLDEARPVVGRALRKSRNDVQYAPLGILDEVAVWRESGAADADVPEHWVELLVAVGDPAPRIAEYAAAGVASVVLSPVGPPPWET
jgi:alkanesulfonate monooxygenase SsuD/methylene tetrahydromethanopterin reductase-like flavin-dependent oxidoreductase (luciferase family)